MFSAVSFIRGREVGGGVDRRHDPVELLVLRQAGDRAGRRRAPRTSAPRPTRSGRRRASPARRAAPPRSSGRRTAPASGSRRARRRAGASAQTSTASWPVADRRDDLEVAPQAEQQLERLAEDLVVLDEDDPHGPRHAAGAYALLGREQQRDSAAGRPRAPRARARDGSRSSSASRPSSGGGSSPVSSVSTLRGSASRRSSTARATSSNEPPPATGSPVGEPEPGALADRDAVRLDVARGDRDRARRDLVGASCIAAAFSLGGHGRVEGDHRREPRLERDGRHDAHRLRGVLGRVLGGHEHVAVVREHDRLRRRVVPRPPRAAPPSTGSSSGRRRRRARRGSRTAAGCPRRRRPRSPRWRAARRRNGVEQALLALARLLVHVRDLDARRPSRARSRARARGRGRRCGRAP